MNVILSNFYMTIIITLNQNSVRHVHNSYIATCTTCKSNGQFVLHLLKLNAVWNVYICRPAGERNSQLNKATVFRQNIYNKLFISIDTG